MPDNVETTARDGGDLRCGSIQTVFCLLGEANLLPPHITCLDLIHLQPRSESRSGPSLARIRLPEHQPVAVMPPGVVGGLPARGDDRPLADLDDAVTRGEAGRDGGIDHFDVGPLEAMAVNI